MEPTLTVMQRDEKSALTAITTKLAQQYDQIPTEAVRAVVRVAYQRFTGTVRNYIPILVERRARVELDRLADQVAETERLSA